MIPIDVGGVYHYLRLIVSRCAKRISQISVHCEPQTGRLEYCRTRGSSYAANSRRSLRKELQSHDRWLIKEILAEEVMVFLLVAIGIVAKLLQFILGFTLLVMFVKPVAYRRRGHALRNVLMLPLVVHLFAIFLQGGQEVGTERSAG